MVSRQLQYLTVVHFLFAASVSSFGMQPSTTSKAGDSTRLCMSNHDLSGELPRRQLLGIFGSTVALLGSTMGSPALADVSEGNALPQGAQQFARVVKLKTDLKNVKARAVSAGPDEINQKEWDNISKFLRNVYSTAENDMKSIAKGVYNPENQKQALRDAEQIKKYSQAADVSVGKKDAKGLASIIDKLSELLDSFLESLSDVPDEI